MMNYLNKKINMSSYMIMNLPTPANISILWNYGSMLGIMFMIQFMTGIFVTMNYIPNSIFSFSSISEMTQNLNNGWLLRFFHSNGASMFLLFMYIHIGRSIYYNNMKNKLTAISGLIILLLTMLTAFLGYVLPWGQMSFWGATVITSLMSAIPIYGKNIVIWLWGNYSITTITLTRFFTLHYLLPFILLMMIILHMNFLHMKGSFNPMITKSMEKIQFSPFFSMKDLITILLLFLLLFLLSTMSPYLLMDPENFLIANPMITPIHIQPEWYFLVSYAILRCIPNKLGGVIALILSILFILKPITSKLNQYNYNFFFLKKIIFWLMVFNIMMLMWMGACPISDPMILMAQILSMLYFIIFMII